MRRYSIDIDEIMDRLGRGETLLINDQMRHYISMESSDTPVRFVVRSILAKYEDHCWATGTPAVYKEEGRYRSLAEALLSLMDWELQEKDDD